jgi:hypothetical protein
MLAYILPHVVKLCTLFLYYRRLWRALQGSSWQHVRLWLLDLLFEIIVVQLIAFPTYKHPIREALYFGDSCLYDGSSLQVEWNRCYYFGFYKAPIHLEN